MGIKLVCDCGNTEDFRTIILEKPISNIPYGWDIEGFEIICNKCGSLIEITSNGI